MIKKYINVAAVFEAGQNIYAVSFYGKIFKIQDHTSTVTIHYANASRHNLSRFFVYTWDIATKIDTDDLVIVEFGYKERKGDGAYTRADLAKLKLIEVTKNHETCASTLEYVENT